ncbi:hypothetical protein SASPL_109054 [Salvia splendens]|uniref:histidine--tRNA ligase n=1 Tax=Salvia splendens TaxID=180675 RepID=A0A8X9A8S9_SALSN|nr:hypothetical protein SASPL_109054 [Salvia splendens]
MRAITNCSFLIHYRHPSAAAFLRSLRHPLPLDAPSLFKVKALSTSASYSELDNARTGRSSSLASHPPSSDFTQKIDVNPPKGTRDFPPEEMRMRTWLFQNFREVSQLFGFEEVDFPVLESEALFVRKAGEEIKDQCRLTDFESLVHPDLLKPSIHLQLKNPSIMSYASAVQMAKLIVHLFVLCPEANCTSSSSIVKADTPGLYQPATMLHFDDDLFPASPHHKITLTVRVTSCHGWFCVHHEDKAVSAPGAVSSIVAGIEVFRLLTIFFLLVWMKLYCFEDRGNRRVALRPELTPSLARLVLQKGKSVSLPLKWFAIGQCWRYERMTRGRRREHYQWNMDIIGVPNVTAEAELISSIVTFFKRIGITASDVGFKVSSRKVLQEVLRRYSVPDSLFGRVCVTIDKLEKIPIDDIKNELRAAELSEQAVEELLQILTAKSLEELEEKLCTSFEALAELKQLFSLAQKYGYSEWIQFDASIVRGLAYYTGIVFEGFDREGKLRAICGGGRYDRLLSTFGGEDVPACGFGFGDAVIIELLKDRGLLPELNPQVQNVVCSLGQDLQGAASLVAARLREKGQTVDLVLENKPLKWAFKRAARVNAQRLIIVGSAEWEKGMVGVKLLSSGEQYEIRIDELE